MFRDQSQWPWNTKYKRSTHFRISLQIRTTKTKIQRRTWKTWYQWLNLFFSFLSFFTSFILSSEEIICLILIRSCVLEFLWSFSGVIERTKSLSTSHRTRNSTQSTFSLTLCFVSILLLRTNQKMKTFFIDSSLHWN